MLRLSAQDWAEAFAASEPGTPHNEAREQVWQALLDILVDQHDRSAPEALVRTTLQKHGVEPVMIVMEITERTLVK